ncbi:polyprenyl synthetase family protein [Liberiplasma polymorphum]|uniref:polyprenyl synthetase family protein n=1 Tax=Liberiplasma polymorphum TaxID=3374570 RepID=UPI0037713FEE
MIEVIEKTLKNIVQAKESNTLTEAMSYALLNGGKRLRPLLLLKVLESYQVPWEDYVDIACSIEMIHTYSLIHDDLPAMDNDDLRRGVPTLHVAFDEATAILTGDALLTDAFNLITNNESLSDAQKVKLVRILSGCSGSSGMVYGQLLDLESENTKIPLEVLKRIHVHKTAKLIQAPLMMASVIASLKDVSIWEEIGYFLGLAFQIQDDILEVTSDEANMGKSLSDLRNDKSTYVKLIGLEESKKMVDLYFKEIENLLSKLSIDKEQIQNYFDQVRQRNN